MSSLISSGKTYTYQVAASSNANYQDTGGTELTDGVTDNGSGLYGNHNVGWQNVNGQFTVDLGDEYSLDYVKFFLASDAGGVQGGASLVVSGSTNGTDFTSLDTFSTADGDWSNASGIRWSNDLDVSGTYRYVRFTITRVGEWTFWREVEIYGDSGAVARRIFIM
jgi:hypothetical protein